MFMARFIFYRIELHLLLLSSPATVDGDGGAVAAIWTVPAKV
jgi:hypothetical protein